MFCTIGEEFDEIFILEKLNNLMDKDLYKKIFVFILKDIRVEKNYFRK